MILFGRIFNARNSRLPIAKFQKLTAYQIQPGDNFLEAGRKNDMEEQEGHELARAFMGRSGRGGRFKTAMAWWYLLRRTH